MERLVQVWLVRGRFRHFLGLNVIAAEAVALTNSALVNMI